MMHAELCKAKIALWPPSTREVLRKIKEAVGGALDEWPIWHLNALVADHYKRNERWNLTLFLLCNTAMPTDIVYLYKIRGVLGDDDAVKDLAGIIRRHQFGELEKWEIEVMPFRITVDTPKTEEEKKHKWDGVGDPVKPLKKGYFYKYPVTSPSFARTIEGCGPWVEAIKMLNQAPMPMTLRDEKFNARFKLVPMTDPDFVPRLEFAEE